MGRQIAMGWRLTVACRVILICQFKNSHDLAFSGAQILMGNLFSFSVIYVSTSCHLCSAIIFSIHLFYSTFIHIQNHMTTCGFINKKCFDGLGFILQLYFLHILMISCYLCILLQFSNGPDKSKYNQ